MARSWPVTFEPNLDSKYFSFLLNRIDMLAATLREMPLSPGVRADVDRGLVAEAVRGTTGIDGNGLSLAEVEAVLARPGTAVTPEQHEILNAELAISQIRKRKPLPLAELAENNIKDLHDLVSLGVDYLDQAPGEYRTSDVIVGAYQCPPAIEVPTLMAMMTDYLNTRSVMTMHPIVRALLAHFYLVSIHPFADASGKTARAVEAYLMYHGGYSQVGFYSMSSYFFKNRAEYVGELEAARFDNDGELRDWVIFGLEGFLAELEERRDRIFQSLRLVAMSQYLTELVGAKQITPRLAAVVARLSAERFGLTPRNLKDRNIPWLADAYSGLTERSVRNDLTIMRRLGLITETDGVIKVSFKALEGV